MSNLWQHLQSHGFYISSNRYINWPSPTTPHCKKLLFLHQVLDFVQVCFSNTRKGHRKMPQERQEQKACCKLCHCHKLVNSLPHYWPSVTLKTRVTSLPQKHLRSSPILPSQKTFINLLPQKAPMRCWFKHYSINRDDSRGTCHLQEYPSSILSSTGFLFLSFLSLPILLNSTYLDLGSPSGTSK